MILFIMVCAAVIQGGSGAVPDGGVGILRLDREISGLLDGYLEAVPECPVRADTPIRIWLLDLSWMRATAARLSIVSPALAGHDSAVNNAFKEYIAACDSYLSVYAGVREFYHGAGPPDSARSVALEDELIIADSAWLESGTRLFGMLGEED